MKPGKPSPTDVHAALGRDTPRKGARPLRIPVGSMAAIALVAGLGTMSAWTFMEQGKGLTVLPEPSGTDEQTLATQAPATPVETPAETARVESGRSGANIRRTTTDSGNVVSTWSPRSRDGSGPAIMNAQTWGQDPRMAAIPNDDLVEESPFGKLPVTGQDGLRPMEQYARPWSGARGTRVSIVIAGLGLSQTGTQNAIRELPSEVTLAFASSGNSLQRWMQEARRNGHEILLQIPMQPYDYPANDPGPDTLLTDSKAASNLEKLHRAMGRITNYTGIVNYQGGSFTASAASLEPVMRDITDRGLLFLDDGSSAQSSSGTIAKAINGPHAFADMQLDDQVNEQAILKRLDDLERLARRNGQAIGIASAFDESIAAVSRWANEAQARGIEIVGVSALASDPAGQ